MKTTIVSTSESALSVLQSMANWAETIEFAYAWVSSAGGESPHWTRLPLAKVTRCVVGTQFAQTEPAALRQLQRETNALRIVIDSIGTFHPKVLIARRGASLQALVGSANFTRAAFSTNTELCVHLEGRRDSDPAVDLSRFIDRCWARAVPMRDDWLERYELAWKRRPRPTGLVPQASAQASGVEDLDLAWPQYLELIRNQEGRRLASGYRLSVFGDGESYLSEIDACLAAFRSSGTFAQIAAPSRKLIAGLRPHSCGLLGSMQGAGHAKHIVAEQPDRLGAVLDRIDASGVIAVAQAREAVRSLVEIEGIGLAVATRLLTAKRPDVFLSVNGGSRPNIAALCRRGAPSSPRTYADLLERLWETPWWNAPEPSEPAEERVWRARVALLDAALYEEV